VSDRAATIRVGTRGSALALAQARVVTEGLGAAGVPAEIVVVETAGDRRAPDTPWGEGAFVAAIQHALLEGRVDVAVHSAKDVPTEQHADLVIAAFLERADPHDCLVLPAGRQAASLDGLPTGSRIGTDSPRRTGFLRAARPDLRVEPLHGNVDTRLRRLDEGSADALVLAAAGLTRLGRADRISLLIPAKVVPPAPGQGAIAVEVRAADAWTRASVGVLDHADTRTCVEAERAVLRFAGGGCRSPIGALGSVREGRLHLLAGYATTDGSAADVVEATGDPADGERLARELVARLDRSVGIRGAGRTGPRVLVTRPAGSAGALARALEQRGLDPVSVPTVELRPATQAQSEDLADALVHVDWLVVTSANAVAAIAAGIASHAGRTGAAHLRAAAVGARTASALREATGLEAWTPSVATAGSLADELPIRQKERVLIATTPEADGRAAERLRARGAHVHVATAYSTTVGPEGSREPLHTALTSPRGMDGISFLSGSAVRGLVALADADDVERWRSLPAACIGSETAAIARANGFTDVREVPETGAAAVADLLAATLAPAAAHTGGRTE
jgi:hydroxymethylbilane synthase